MESLHMFSNSKRAELRHHTKVLLNMLCKVEKSFQSKELHELLQPQCWQVPPNPSPPFFKLSTQ